MDDSLRELAGRLAEGNESSGDGTYLRRGVVTAVNTAANLYRVTIGGASIPDPSLPPSVPAYKGVSAAVNDSVDVLFDGPAPRVIGVVGVGAAAETAMPATRFYTANINGTTPTPGAWNEFYTQNSIGVVPACNMEVEVFFGHGFSAVTNTLSFRIMNGVGDNITHGASNYPMSQQSSYWQSSAVRGTQIYSAGATAGFRLSYALDSGNVYLNASVKVTFHRL